MRVKRYVAESIPEAIARVKSDLGRNAIILHTKPFKEGGFLGFFSKRRFEVIAAIDENAGDTETAKGDKKPEEKKPQPKAETNMGNSQTQFAEYTQNTAFTPYNSYPAHTSNATQTSFAVPTPNTAPKVQPAQSTVICNSLPETAAAVEPELSQLKEELAEVKELIKQVVGVSADKIPVNRAFQTEPLPVATPVEMKDAGKPQGVSILKPFDLEEELLDYLLQNAATRADVNVGDPNSLLEFCKQVINQSLRCDEPFRRNPAGKPLVVALIGPTGVGKTTTIAKLAANFNLFEGKKVGLLTIDTYRIAAVEHLKTYGEIINLPVEVIYTLDDLDRSLENFKDYDLILIDTAGRSPHNQSMMEELRKFLTHPAIDMIQLVISATTQYRDMVGIVDNFAVIPYTHIIFTKLDETGCLGPVVSLAWRARKPISYVTTGQNVPDDIEVAKAEKLTDRLFKGSYHG